jgi:splicing factor 45
MYCRILTFGLTFQAVNALEGRIFNGNAISARFFDNEKFEKGIYE